MDCTMIKGIEGFYIVNQTDSELLGSYESINQSGEEWDMSIFSSAMNALQNFAKNFGQKETKFLDIGDTRVFANVDEAYKIIYLLRCKPKFKEKKARNILSKLKESFTENLRSYRLTADKIKDLREDIFDRSVIEILKISEEGFKQLE